MMIKKFLKYLPIAVFMLMFNVSVSVSAPLEVSITEGQVKPTRIAVSPFFVNEGSITKQGDVNNIQRIISNDLSSSGLFRSIDTEAFTQSPAAMRYRPLFSDWRVIKTEILVVGKITQSTVKKMAIEVSVWDIVAERQILTKKYIVPAKSWRRLSHIIADDVYSRVTGEQPYFDSRILYVAEDKVGSRRRKRLAIMDSDGARVKYITQGKFLVLTPRFSPNGKTLTYLSYRRGVPSVYLHSLRSGKISYLGQFKGMTYAPRFSPDSKKIIFSFAKNGSSSIWEMQLATRKITQLTRGDFIDTSPSYSHDGKFITFTSNRSGRASIYTMTSGGQNIKRISSDFNSYTTPVWSPRGDTIAFTKQAGGKFYIGVMNTDGSGERLLTNSFMDEGPAFSPNGRVIMFFRNDGISNKVQLMSIDITGYNLRKIKTKTSASDPAWSRLNSK